MISNFRAFLGFGPDESGPPGQRWEIPSCAHCSHTSQSQCLLEADVVEAGRRASTSRWSFSAVEILVRTWTLPTSRSTSCWASGSATSAASTPPIAEGASPPPWLSASCGNGAALHSEGPPKALRRSLAGVPNLACNSTVATRSPKETGSPLRGPQSGASTQVSADTRSAKAWLCLWSTAVAERITLNCDTRWCFMSFDEGGLCPPIGRMAHLCPNPTYCHPGMYVIIATDRGLRNVMGASFSSSSGRHSKRFGLSL
mmetsp:Transcript_16580/g.49486  ORF Transcript_16580/g.49486 Transcript_16580/m.49486 type:complete len:257 (+) Transcript_16580:188-958(+)